MTNTGHRRFAGMRAVVTGGAQGIGRTVVERLCAEGATVALLDLNGDRGWQAASEINDMPATRDAGAWVQPFEVDVTDADAARAAIAEFESTRGGVDVLVNNAGITRDGMFFRMDRADWDAVLATNLTSMYVMTQAVLPGMSERRTGAIVNLSSRSALGNRGQANYAAAKAGVQGLTATLAIELGPFGIRVNAVAPGFIATDMTRATAERIGKNPAEYEAEVAERTPLRRVGRPEDVAAAIAFLASNDAAYVSGQTLYVNGGAR